MIYSANWYHATEIAFNLEYLSEKAILTVHKYTPTLNKHIKVSAF